MDREERRKRLMDRSSKRLQKIVGESSERTDFSATESQFNHSSKPELDSTISETNDTLIKAADQLITKTFNSSSEEKLIDSTEETSNNTNQLINNDSILPSNERSPTDSSFRKELFLLNLLLILTCIVVNFRIYTSLLIISITVLGNKFMVRKQQQQQRSLLSVKDLFDLTRFLILYLNCWLLATMISRYWLAQIYQVKYY